MWKQGCQTIEGNYCSARIPPLHGNSCAGREMVEVCLDKWLERSAVVQPRPRAGVSGCTRVPRGGFVPQTSLTWISPVHMGDLMGSLHSHGIRRDSQPLGHPGVNIPAVPRAQSWDLAAVSTLLHNHKSRKGWIVNHTCPPPPHTHPYHVYTHTYTHTSVQSLSRVRPFATPWTAACQASLSITNSQSLLKLMSIGSVMLSNHLIPCHPLLLLPIFPSIRVFSNESVLHIRWPKYWSLSFSINPSNEYSGLISFRLTGLIFL